MRRATLMAAGLLGGAALLLLAWWLVGVGTLGGTPTETRCSTSLPDGAFASLQWPVHLLAGLLLVGALVALASARPPGTHRAPRVLVPLVVGLAVLALAFLGELFALVALAALGVLPVAGVVAGRLLVGARGRGAAAWARRALALEVLLWASLLFGLGLNALSGTLAYADLFCF